MIRYTSIAGTVYIYILELTVTNLINRSRATRNAPQISDPSGVKISISKIVKPNFAYAWCLLSQVKQHYLVKVFLFISVCMQYTANFTVVKMALGTLLVSTKH